MSQTSNVDEKSDENLASSPSESISELSYNSDFLDLEPLLWLKHQMKSSKNPQDILELLLPNTHYKNLSNYECWDIILQILTQPYLFKRTKINAINTLNNFLDLLEQSKNILALTGAGVSVASGIPDFRSKNGLYARLSIDFPNLPDPQAMFDINYFKFDPKPFFKFAKEIYPGNFEPSLSHQFIKFLEIEHKLLRNYTQNIDTLENEAHITKKIECHGSFATASCMKCKYQVEADIIKEDVLNQIVPLCPKCQNQINATSIICDNDFNESADLREDTFENTITNSISTTVLTIEEGKITKMSEKDILNSYKREMMMDSDEDDFKANKINSIKTNLNDSNRCKEQTDSGDEVSSNDSSSPYFFDILAQKEWNKDKNQLSLTSEPSSFRHKAIMKPDIVFFGEGLGEKFHLAFEEDKDLCDLLIVMGSSLKVRPVSMIPNAISSNVPQILINKEPLTHLNFDIEFLGDCDTIIAEIVKRMYKNRDIKLSNNPSKSPLNDDINDKTICDENPILGTESTKRSHTSTTTSINEINESAHKKSRFVAPFKVFESYNIKWDSPLRKEIYVFDHILKLFVLNDKYLNSSASSFSSAIGNGNQNLLNDSAPTISSSQYSEPESENTDSGVGNSNVPSIKNYTFLGTDAINLKHIVAWDLNCEIYFRSREKEKNSTKNQEFEDLLKFSIDPKGLPLHLVKLVNIPNKSTFFETFLGQSENEENILDREFQFSPSMESTEITFPGKYYLNPFNLATLSPNLKIDKSTIQNEDPIFAIVTLENPVYSLINNAIDVSNTFCVLSSRYAHQICDKDGVVTGLPTDTFLFVPPNRYIFPEAEIKL